MRFKKLVSILLVAMMIFSLAACGQGDEPANNSTADSNSGAAESKEEGLSGTIVVWSWDVALKSLQVAAENFKKIHPNVEFQFEDMGTDQIYDKMLTGLASGTGLPDVVSLEGERVPLYASKFPKGFVDLTDVVEEDHFLPVKMAEVTVNGKVMAFPWDAAPCGLFYRTDLFEQAGVKPEDIKTWDDYIEAGKKLDKIGVKMLPLAVSKNDTVFRLILNQLGAFYFDGEGKTVLDSEAAVKAMTIVKKMYDANITYDNVNWDGLVTCTKEGKVATVVNAVWWAGTLQDECDNLSGKWAVMELPLAEAGGKIGAVNGGSNIVIPSASQNKRAAVEFVKFAMTDKGSVIKGFSDYGLYPSYIPSYSDPIFNSEVEYFNGQKIWKLFTEAGKEVPRLNFTENFAEVNDLVVDAQARITLKGAEVEATMDELQKGVVNKLGK
ncbi:sugar ABC transporter substrate-binding protein [Wukongibacter baidiensis]|uniref:ABC transporter substrate-binding protein n=1 Tax=Wukongibacter baidiensis TaxID=1723361 RepID=UPI003D80009A